ncbi:hypothetical protein OEZ86_010076 [Tetradesmus obliquus]|uniref:Uncharacterized protein n=1 Tax=Tetradesmus obliquus TaxID=3088 RepID=A0ABY8UPB9_TETOB|nr:hypothetical protein OEZ85_001511 [Tetradesmus obliquus]WIA43636.1 hypothetical protein OEZ86_010076 [Tetradesmus obliquus]
MNGTTKEDNITLELAARFLMQVGHTVVSPPVTSALLTKPAWRMARLSEAKRMVYLAAAHSKAEMQVKMNNQPPDQTEIREAQLLVLQNAYLAFFAALLVDKISDVPDAASNIPVFDTVIGSFSSKVRINLAQPSRDLGQDQLERCWFK